MSALAWLMMKGMVLKPEGHGRRAERQSKWGEGTEADEQSRGHQGEARRLEHLVW